MLVLTRKKDERINIGSDIQVVILEIQGNRVRLGLVAPPQVPILREELQAHAAWTVPAAPIEPATRKSDSTGGVQ